MIINNSNGKISESPIDPNVGSKMSDKKSPSIHFAEETPRWHLDEIIMSSKIRQEVEDAIVFCKNRRGLIEKWDLGRFLKGGNGVGINLYGDPGTGKSITAEGIASATNKKIIKVNYSEIQDSLVGGTEKNLTALFNQAATNDSIIFFDEADGLLGKRMSDGPNAQTNNNVKSQLLTLIDRTDVIVIYSTNLFENYDSAFFRRILYHIRFDLPKTDELEALWKFHLGEKIPKATDFSYHDIAVASKGLAGGHIKNITLKLCIQLAANRLSDISLADVLGEIERTKTSLKDMQTRFSEIVDAKDVPESVKQEQARDLEMKTKNREVIIK